MAKGISIDFLANVAGFLRGTKHAAEGLDEILDSLDDVARDGQDVGDDVGRSLEDVGRDAKDAGDQLRDELGDGAKDAARDVERNLEDAGDAGKDSADKIEKSYRDMLDAVSRAGKGVGDSVSADVKRGADGAGEGLGELKDEAASTARETAASFDGSADSIVDMFQETAANALGGFGPAGAAAGLLLAAGLGLAKAEWDKRAEEMETRTADMFADMLESGNKYLSESFISGQIEKIVTDAEDAVVKYSEAQKVAAATGLDLATVVRAYAGDMEASGKVSARLSDEIGTEQESMAKAVEDGWMAQADVHGKAMTELQSWRDTLSGTADDTAQAAERMGVYHQAVGVSSEAVRDYTQALAGQDDAVAAARDMIKENSEALKGNADQLRTENVGALSELAGELLGVQEAGDAAKLSTKDLTALQVSQADQFVKTAGAAGIGADAALDLATELGLIPADVATKIRENGADWVKAQADSVTDHVNGIPDTKTISVLWNVSATDLQAAVDAAARNTTGVRVPISYYQPRGTSAP